MIKSGKVYKFAGFLLFSLALSPAYADPPQDPCAGDTALLNLINRPTQADSACVVKYKEGMLEAGYQYDFLSHSSGNQQVFPQAQFRIGLPWNTEFTLLTNNYIHQSQQSTTGTTAATVGVKHEIGYNAHWLGSVETLVTLPNGSAAFGSVGTGVAANAIVSYTFNPTFNLSLMFGVTSLTAPSNAGGQRYTSINPDAIFTYSATRKLDIYVELYGQTKTAPHLSSGFNCDAGVTYLLRKFMTVDAEVGRKISGDLSGFNEYVGAGVAFLFS